MLPSLPEVTFSSGVNAGDTACATFNIINDGNLELDHEFTVSISGVTPTGPNIPAILSSTMVTITDDEGMLPFIIACVSFLLHFSPLHVSNKDGGGKDPKCRLNTPTISGCIEQDVNNLLFCIN